MSHIVRISRSNEHNRKQKRLVNTHSCEYFSAYVGEIVLMRTGREDEFIPLYPFDVVFIMDSQTGSTVDSWNVPAELKKED